MQRFLILAVFIACNALGPATSAFAQPLPDRPIPADAKRARMEPGNSPEVVINGKVMRLAPGARIFDQNNRIVVPASLDSGHTVKYIVDQAGQIQTVWILTPDEARRR